MYCLCWIFCKQSWDLILFEIVFEFVFCISYYLISRDIFLWFVFIAILADALVFSFKSTYCLCWIFSVHRGIGSFLKLHWIILQINDFQKVPFCSPFYRKIWRIFLHSHSISIGFLFKFFDEMVNKSYFLKVI